METDFPEGEAAKVTLALEAPRTFTLALHRPWWAGQGFAVTLNGSRVASVPAPGGYVEIRRRWKTGDRVSLVLPKALHLEPLPDNPGRVAIMWGPLVLAGDLGATTASAEQAEATNLGGAASVPVLVSAGRDPRAWLKQTGATPAAFRTSGVGRDRDVELVPFYRLHRRLYAAYWDLFTPAEWEARRAAIGAAEEKQRRLEATTVAYAQPGQMQAERDANLQGGKTSPVQLQHRYGRRAVDWFSVDLAVDPAHALALVVTYNRDERQARSFDILLDGVKVAAQAMPRRSPEEKEEFFDVEYVLPPGLVQGKQKVTVRFQATGGNEVAAVYGVRLVRADAPR
jgi:hypothetical protein